MLDVGENSRLTLTLKNTGLVPLTRSRKYGRVAARPIRSASIKVIDLECCGAQQWTPDPWISRRVGCGSAHTLPAWTSRGILAPDTSIWKRAATDLADAATDNDYRHQYMAAEHGDVRSKSVGKIMACRRLRLGDGAFH